MGLKLELTRLWAWLKKEFTDVEVSIAPVVVTVAQHVKQAIDNGELGFLATAISGLTGSPIPVEVVGILKVQLPRVIATALAIEGLPSNGATEDDIKAFEQRIIDAWALPQTYKSKVITLVAADLYGQIDAFVNSGEQKTFAQWVGFIEDTYQKLKIDFAG